MTKKNIMRKVENQNKVFKQVWNEEAQSHGQSL